MALLDFIPIIGPAVDKLLSLIPDPNARAKAKEEFDSKPATSRQRQTRTRGPSIS
jgi:hypothetical protein